MTLKSILVLAVFLSGYKIFFGQAPFPYSKTWKKIDSLIQQKGLPKSALEEVNKLYAAAKKEKQEAQWVKAVIYQQQLQGDDEADISKAQKNLEREIDAAPPRVAALLKNLEAEGLSNYLQQQRYRLSQRTEVLNDQSDDISTWSPGKLDKKITELYLASLRDEKLLLETNLSAFDAVVLKGNTRQLRPTLYDLLANRALDYFQEDDPERPVAEDAFVMDNPAIFYPRKMFTEYLFKGSDTASNHLIALQLFQNLLRVHAADSDPAARVDADIRRIVFASRYAVLPGKDSLYFSALQELTRQYPVSPAAAQAWYLQAAYFSEKAAAFDPINDSTHQYDYGKARIICEMVLKQKDSSEGRSNCSILLNNIIRQTFHLKTEKVNCPDLPFRALVSYKNVSHIYGRIIRIDDATRDALGTNSWDPEFWKKLLRLPVLKRFDQALPETNDYQEHRVEIKIDAMPFGQYALLSSSDVAFGSGSVLAVQYFFCSSLAFVQHDQDYFVVDRNSGDPLTDVTVQTLYPTYDSRQQKNVFQKSGQYKTDIHGHFRLLPDKVIHYQNRLEFYRGKDYLSVTNENSYAYNNGDAYKNLTAAAYEKEMQKDILFTDRAIYRPGQTVYFKGLLVTRDFISKRYKIREGSKTKLYLMDANSQLVDSAEVIADDFGSIHGSFTLPPNGLNGEFRIRDKETEDSRDFSMEEYKRPKFSVHYEPVKGNYRVGDSLHIRGSALGYAGNAITGSKVSYRILRESRFPYPWFFRRAPAAAAQQIRHGETETDQNGHFSVHFLALPDPQVKKESRPVFTYRIEADITDLNGETRSASTSVSASYQSFQIVSPLPGESSMDTDSLGRIAVTTKNAAGEFLAQRLTIAVYRLKTPDRLIRERYWEQPDQFILPKDDYVKLFPYDDYQDETNKSSWEKEPGPAEITDSTNESGFVALPPMKNTPGWYRVEFKAKDDNGEWITDRRFIELVDSRGNKPAFPVYNTIPSEDQTGEPGTTRITRTGTSATDAFVIRAKEAVDDTLTNYSFFRLNNEIKSTAWKLEEKDRGGFAVNDVFVKNNRWYSSSHLIHVPWTNKELQITYETWRNKLLPGSNEKWKIRISGTKRNKVVAEVLTAMYDASLDQFKPQAWSVPDLYPEYSETARWQGAAGFSDQASLERQMANEVDGNNFYRQYDQLDFPVSGRIHLRGGSMNFDAVAPGMVFEKSLSSPKMAMANFMSSKKNKEVEVDKKDTLPNQSGTEVDPSAVQIRKNFNETAFFLPDLKTDAEGNVDISFTIPEALTQWKWMIFSHTKDLAFGYSEKQVVTQKALMLQPNMPRFFREGDSMRLPVKISNVSGLPMDGTVSLDWLDAADNSNRNALFQNKTVHQPFHVTAGASVVLYFSTSVPDNFQLPVVYRLLAKTASGDAGDGEEGIIPVMTNRMLVTETMPLPMAGRDKRSFSWEKLLNSKASSSLKNQSLTVEYTSNPAWYAVQSLPYLMEFPYECAEQTFNRFYANALAAKIVSSAPAIQDIFEKWKSADTSALLSSLQKNEELKTVLLRETPWVMDAQHENQQKKNIALLFDLVKMNSALKSALDKLKQMQSTAGGFPWFAGGKDDRYITQYIISGIGHLKKLAAFPDKEKSGLDQVVKSSLAFLDKELKSDYDRRPRKEVENIGASQIQYLYMRSFFPDYGVPGTVFPAMNYYRKLAIENWTKQNMYLRGMIALFLYRSGDRKTAADIMRSLKENATQSDALGMYWKAVVPGYYWQESPVETQALLIEAFTEISPDLKMTDQMKYWLLEQKHTNQWSNTKSTADACYALLMAGNNWLAPGQTTDIKLGDYTVHSTEEKTEAGTGYMKKVIPGEAIRSDMGNIEVSIHHEANRAVPSWGAVYWQYFERLDRITPAQSPLSISKTIYRSRNTAGGPLLEPVNKEMVLKPGDELLMRIIIKSDRDMEYVHLKDMRAACLEPKNVLSGYRWQDGLGYYQTTKDQSTSFFFDYLPRGTHVFEYPVFVTTAGVYSNGISTLECMYAPEFAAHTEGISLHVQEK